MQRCHRVLGLLLISLPLAFAACVSGPVKSNDAGNGGEDSSTSMDHCANSMVDGDETDVDCGGEDCVKCSANDTCQSGDDCTSGVCSAGKCASPSCDDGVKNGGETDIDCGGAICDPCGSSGSDYHWETGGWSSCSEMCGGGTKTRDVKCVDEDGNPASGQCDDGEKPESMKICNRQDCSDYEWSTGKWGKCSKKCGGGTETRTVECVKTSDGTKVPDSMCSGSKPEGTRTCNTSSPCMYEWVKKSWSTCNQQCKQTRDVYCQNKTLGEKAADSKCSGSKPASEQSCTGGQCPGGTEMKCNDQMDNDGDGKKDCNDPDCSSASNCTSSMSENPGFCDDGKDNDNDGKTDCNDPECQGADCGPGYNGYKDAVCENMVCVEKNCKDMDDDDNDGKKNCMDPDCSMSSHCMSSSTESMCTDGKDNDTDGNADCTDGDCIGTMACTANGESDLDCDDGKDNDMDGKTDCLDPGCVGQDCDVKGSPYGGAVCHMNSCKETDCSNNEDDDGDGSTDSADTDCP